MKPIEYLRAMAKRRKPATGGRWEPGAVREVTLTVDNRGSRFATRPRPEPTGFVRIERELTQAEVEQIRQRFQTTVSTARTPTHRKDCGCWPRYSYCTCKP